MKKQIATAVAITASFVLWATVLPQTAVDKETKETPTLTPTPAAIASQVPLPEPPEPAMPLITEMEEIDRTIAKPILEKVDEQPPAPVPAPTAENQAEPALEPTDTPAPEPIPKPEVADSSSENMVYVPGFCWIENQGPNQATYTEDMYENGNKIDIMG